MSKIQEYLILSEAGVVELSKLVNEHLEEGWKPKGGPFVLESSVCQAMTRTEKAQKHKDRRQQEGSED